jgi:hypothetical protein
MFDWISPLSKLAPFCQISSVSVVDMPINLESAIRIRIKKTNTKDRKNITCTPQSYSFFFSNIPKFTDHRHDADYFVTNWAEVKQESGTWRCRVTPGAHGHWVHHRQFQQRDRCESPIECLQTCLFMQHEVCNPR